MRYLAVGDIHGCCRALVNLAAFVPFESDDVVITLGDYVDRGPQSRDVLDWLIAFRASHHLIALRGNHDVMMVQARDNPLDMPFWLGFGGMETLVSYGRDGEPATLLDVPAAHWDFLENACVRYHEIDTHFFVHANAEPNAPLAQQADRILYWQRFGHPAPHPSGKVMVCGHTAQANGWPLHAGHAVCLDTKVYETGWLTCLDVATGVFWQANEDGQARLGDLADLPISV